MMAIRTTVHVRDRSGRGVGVCATALANVQQLTRFVRSPVVLRVEQGLEKNTYRVLVRWFFDPNFERPFAVRLSGTEVSRIVASLRKTSTPVEKSISMARRIRLEEDARLADRVQNLWVKWRDRDRT